MQVAYFVNSGSEATELAMMMARLYTGTYNLLALRNCYHGTPLLGHGTWIFDVPQVRIRSHRMLAGSYLLKCRNAALSEGQ